MKGHKLYRIKMKFLLMLRSWKKLFASLLKWIIASVVIGCGIGVIASVFAFAVEHVTEFRIGHPVIIYGLPFGGLLIVFLYKVLGQEKNSGTNLVISSVRANVPIAGRVSFLILVSTVITHLFGGSSGREGAALQFGASLGNYAARKLRLNDSDKKIIMLACMSAAFSALFGTPLAASIFPMEMVSVGIMYYAALVPCVFSSFIAQYVALALGVRGRSIPYLVDGVPEFYQPAMLKLLLVGIGCAAAGSLFCIAFHHSEHLFKKIMPNPFIRVAAGGVAVIILYKIVGGDTYLGLGEEMIHRCFGEAVGPQVFLLKIVFTCLTLCVGFKGGEIVPSLFIGATMGSALSAFIGLPTNVCAACGMAGVFCAVTNSPITAMLIAVELFGSAGLRGYCLVIAISYLLSGYKSLYKEQRIMYSKTENRYINKKSK